MSEQEILIPDIGGAVDVDVIEVQVSVGDEVAVEDSLVTLEGDKATMEIPSPYAGKVKALKIAVGDKVSEGSPILILEVESEAGSKSEEKSATNKEEAAQSSAPEKTESKSQTATSLPTSASGSGISAQKEIMPSDKTQTAPDIDVHAGPAVRRMARELGVNLSAVTGSGEKGRIIKTDVDQYVKQRLVGLSASGGAEGGAGLSIAPPPVIDFSQFGDTDRIALSKIKKLSGASLHRNWVTIPHVTQFGEADITDLEVFRKKHKTKAEEQGFKLTPIVFVMKTIVAALKAFPHFNASLDAGGENLILKKYFNIGVAVDTPNGLVVPVIRGVNEKSLFGLAKELTAISEKARTTGLSIAEMQGSCFTLSSLGGIGGTAFTPIINAPDVAILGLSKAQIKPVYKNGEFIPRLMLPLSLSYDHRVIDGADGARFLVYLADCLSDVCSLLL